MIQLPSENHETAVGQCLFCRRFPKTGTTEHHLIPRTCHKNKWFQKRFNRAEMARTISICRQCHSAIHEFVPREKDLGRHYNTPESLLAHDKIGRFVRWVSKRA